MRTWVSAVTLATAVALLTVWQSIVLTGHAGESQNPPLAEAPTLFDQSQPRFAPGQLVVRFLEGTSQDDIRGLIATQGASVVKVQPSSGLHRLALPAGANVDAVLAAYSSSPLVEEAGLSRIVTAFGAPDDTNYSYQWHLHDTVGGMWAESAWDLSANAGQGVIVAVIDTGVAYEDFTGPGGLSTQTFKQAPDLAGTSFVAPWDFYNNDPHANDDHGHGSHVTGTITQDTGNAYGVAGVAYNATIMPVKVLAFDGTGFDDDLVESIYYAVNNGADVISMSIGFPGTGAPDGNGDVCTEIVRLNDALDFAYASGVVVVAASGNDGTGTVSCPGAHPSVIAVGATRYDGEVAFYSNTGDALSLTAPGGDPNVDQNGDGFSDGVLQETYCNDWLTLLFLGTYDLFCDVFISGTSMATPHVAATAALLLGEDPLLTPDQVRFYLESTARDRGPSGWDPAYGWGVLDAHAALAALMGVSPTPTPTPTAEPPGPSMPDLGQTAVSDPPTSKKAGARFRIRDTVENQGTATAGVSSTRFYLSLDGQWDASDVLLSGSRSVPELAAGATSTGSTRVGIPDATAAGTYYVIVCADDTGLIAEGDETNNCLASTATIDVTADTGGGGGGGGGPPPGRGRNK